MPFIAVWAFYDIVCIPIPEFSLQEPVFPCAESFTFYAYEFLGCFAPSDSVEMTRLSANVAYVSPVPITSWKVAVQVFGRFSQRIRFISRMNQLAILADHGEASKREGKIRL